MGSGPALARKRRIDGRLSVRPEPSGASPDHGCAQSQMRARSKGLRPRRAGRHVRPHFLLRASQRPTRDCGQSDPTAGHPPGQGQCNSVTVGRTLWPDNRGDYSACVPEVPQNHKRASCDLTVADRLALYDHVIREANQQITKAEITSNDDLYVDWVAKLKKDENLSGPKSHLEALAEMRDFKRRRQSYRAKNVHITKKSYTEVIREVIGVHCNELSRLWQEEMKEEEESKIPKHSHRRDSKDRRSSSTESHTSSRDRHTSHQRRQRSKERSQKLSHEEENSSKGRRDSHSPEERHRHHHKKKKKKKSSK
ncbi:U11/U12 small nuclear ribonucleoprotein 48 kDa protein isoform X3 [Denticeps clupeoides]|uniref:U11/U12 small nuclear ribonucleoprotein 48 kDa protein isoform X3 n=1 Tax=Denticeps clupeoides TaxID=299321 RepID=UPI0010A4F87C|nr:U11/U12 small nuclear ribonucleoprotein 48 kDa protein isoform X3 [Denticeps clupeoides]